MFHFGCRFVSKVIMFQDALQFKDAIILCYNRLNIVRINSKVPPSSYKWHIFQINVDCLSLVVSGCVFNPSSSHWLLFDAL